MFECDLCGACCRHLVRKVPMGEETWRFGMLLFEPELVLFNKQHVAPFWAVGTKGNRKHPKVVSYQLAVSNCPHLRGNRCAVHKYRPLSCRSYPLTLDIDPNTDQVTGGEVGSDCHIVKPLTGTKIELGEHFSKQIALDAYRLQLAIKDMMMGKFVNQEEVFVFSLSDHKFHKVEVDTAGAILTYASASGYVRGTKAS